MKPTYRGAAKNPKPQAQVIKRAIIRVTYTLPVSVALGSVACNGLRRKHLRLNPPISAGVEQVERQNAAIQHLVMEGPDVELWTQFLPSAFAELDELELPDLVTQGLAGQAM